MNPCRDSERLVGQRWRGTPLLSTQVFKELTGLACASCGARHYYLVLRVSAWSQGTSLAARCSRCHEPRRCLSEDRLVQDIEQAARMPPAG
ncbi:MAG: hypothetical protein EWM72_02079 [Nitrospira sp.]|nr:MAG: hypothetical protein EWM72_02079 [Nitrospira sp.]